MLGLVLLAINVFFALGPFLAAGCAVWSCCTSTAATAEEMERWEQRSMGWPGGGECR